MNRQQKIPGPDHPITVEPSDAHVVVSTADAVIADSRHTLVLQEAAYPPVYYVPLGDVDPAVLRPTPTQTYCPYKGDASYYSVETPGGTVTDAVWRYAEPYPAVAQIAGHVAFYPDRVSVTVDA
ncbi:DUF427 domain-containing protein [Tsukamurella soli]|uniref:DUF427 domain-containing protein n=1 Tax=Tsukamurella soli TaxID=644556 RepID=A0ABP8JUA7_9ACTN